MYTYVGICICSINRSSMILPYTLQVKDIACPTHSLAQRSALKQLCFRPVSMGHTGLNN